MGSAAKCQQLRANHKYKMLRVYCANLITFRWLKNYLWPLCIAHCVCVCVRVCVHICICGHYREAMAALSGDYGYIFGRLWLHSRETIATFSGDYGYIPGTTMAALQDAAWEKFVTLQILSLPVISVSICSQLHVHAYPGEGGM